LFSVFAGLSYALFRRIRRWRRRIFGPQTPSWASDLYGLLDYVNWFQLFPILFTLLERPEHFYNRFELALRKRPSGLKSIYPTPVKFASQMTVLLFLYIPPLTLGLQWLRDSEFLSDSTNDFLKGLLAALAAGGISKVSRLLFAGAVLASLPVAIPVFSAILLLLAGLPFLPFDKKRIIRQLRTPWEIHNYRHALWQARFWGLFYYYGYTVTLPLLLIPIIAAGFGAVAISALVAKAAAYFGHESVAHGIVSSSNRLILAGAIVAAARIVIRPYCALLLGTLQPAAKALTILWEQDLVHRIKDLFIDVKVRRRWRDPSPLPAYDIDKVDSAIQLVEKRITLISKCGQAVRSDAMGFVRRALPAYEILQIGIYRLLKPQCGEASAKLDKLLDFAGVDAACHVAAATAARTLSGKAYYGILESMRMLSASLVCLQRRCSPGCSDTDDMFAGSTTAVQAIEISWGTIWQWLHAEQMRVHDGVMVELEAVRKALHEIDSLPEPEMKTVGEVLASMAVTISQLSPIEQTELPARPAP
jgi:hypothetical protein